jgi:hypothetical protein
VEPWTKELLDRLKVLSSEIDLAESDLNYRSFLKGEVLKVIENHSVRQPVRCGATSHIYGLLVS